MFLLHQPCVVGLWVCRMFSAAHGLCSTAAVTTAVWSISIFNFYPSVFLYTSLCNYVQCELNVVSRPFLQTLARVLLRPQVEWVFSCLCPSLRDILNVIQSICDQCEIRSMSSLYSQELPVEAFFKTSRVLETFIWTNNDFKQVILYLNSSCCCSNIHLSHFKSGLNVSRKCLDNFLITLMVSRWWG